VDRLACIDVPALPLQLLVREHPDWQPMPVAVVAEDSPQAPLLWVNERARHAGLLPGQRYAAALSLAADLRAGTVSRAVITQGVARLTELLRRHTPEVEPARDEPGVFWLNASGFERLYGSLPDWTGAVRDEVARAGFTARIAVGFTRFGVYAVAKAAARGHRILRDIEEESRLARAVPLARLGVDPDFRDALDPLGVKTVGDLLRLPAGGILRRFGPDAHRLHRLAAGHLWTPLQAERPQPPRERRADLEPPDADVERLLFLAKRLLDALLVELRGRGEAIQTLILRLGEGRGAARSAQIRPATPTLDGIQLLRLVRLKLESLQLAEPIAEVVLRAEVVPATPEQLRLATPARRPPDAAGRALASLRAALGDAAVVSARLLDAHLPERRFRWEPLCGMNGTSRAMSREPWDEETSKGRRGEAAQERRDEQGVLHSRHDSRIRNSGIPHSDTIRSPQSAIRHSVRPLVRRIYRAPIPLPPRPRHEPDGWLLAGMEDGPVSHLRGPYVVASEWWAEAVHRDYYFVILRRGDVLWVYRDRRSRRWFLQGRVE
jgi:protein ImuB